MNPMRKIIGPLLLLFGALASPGCARPESDGDWATSREGMIRQIERHDAFVGREGQRIGRPVLEAMRQVPRHLFVPEALRARAYEDRALPIGNQQTISQPYIVALMTDLLATGPDQIVLEVGTGSGYQAAVLSRLVRHVYSLEIIAPLAAEAAGRLSGLGYRNVTVRHGDGYMGWPEAGPFDAIMVTAGADHIPQPLVDQLKPGGRLVIPVGSSAANQQLVLLQKDRQGRIRTQQILPVAFVPFTRNPRE